LQVKAGNLPSSVAKPIVNRILDAANVRTIDVDEHVTNVTITQGKTGVTAGP
jgi:hypothetical protein